MDKTITVMVPLTFINEPHNLLLSANAVLTHLRREVEVTCLPGDILDEIVVDLAGIHPGAALKAGELVLPPGVTLVTDPEEVIVTAHVEVEPEAPAEGGAEAEEAP
jgi:large subunit ribosomal protein L25